MRFRRSISIVLVTGLLFMTVPGFAKEVFECNNDHTPNVCATITVPECVTPNTPFNVRVQGSYESSCPLFGCTGYWLLENTAWHYNISPIDGKKGTVAIDSPGIEIATDPYLGMATFDETFTLNRPAGTYTYTFVFGNRSGFSGWYDVAVDIDVDFAASSNLVALDIKPQSCPNPLNISQKGVLSAAIVGTDDVDVAQIDPSTIELEGVLPIYYAYEDVATPYEPRTGKNLETDCTDAGPDGVMDLTLKFKSQDIVEALTSKWGELVDGEVITVTVTGQTNDTGSCESAITGEDVVRIINKQ